MKRPHEVANTPAAKRDRGRKVSVSIARKIAPPPKKTLSHEEVVAKYCVPLSDEEWSARLNFQGKLGVFDPTLSIYYNDLNRFEEKQRLFLLAYGTYGIVRDACHAARVSRRMVAEWLSTDENFREAYEAAEEDATDDLEDHAIKRAKDSSDTLMVLLLKAKRPDKYSDRAQKQGNKPKVVEKQVWEIGDLKLEF